MEPLEELMHGRTLPRVRELKRVEPVAHRPKEVGRTLPRVRELKPSYRVHERGGGRSHPSQGA